MRYVDLINAQLRPAVEVGPLVLDLFAGCGGLALGFEAQGFQTHGFEVDPDCCATYRYNLKGECTKVFLTPDTPVPQAGVIIGGPPCQPFSVGGSQLGLRDARDGFPVFISAVERLRPEIWLFENVRGMLYRNRWYLEEILAALRALGYLIEFRLMNAVRFGVPQNRERIVVVGHRGKFKFPSALPHRATVGDALGELAVSCPPESKFLTASMDAYVARYEQASDCIRPRDLYMDRPARTLTCRNLAGATGDMQRIRLPDGRRRRLLLREAARLQSFPDWFQFYGAEGRRFNQVGNAVPPLFAYHLAGSIREYLGTKERLNLEQVAASTGPLQPALF